MAKKKYNHVDYLWNPSTAKKMKSSEVDLLLYRSNLLGADLRITNFGGGNTSCKALEKDPLTKKKTEIMYVKGSGGDIGTLKRNGLAGLYMEKLNNLREIYRGLEHEDEMVALYQHCIYDLDSRAPSIDTALHAFLPFKHIDHLHPDAVIAIAAAKNSKALTKKIWGDKMGWLPWQRPGFDLGIELSKHYEENPQITGIILAAKLISCEGFKFSNSPFTISSNGSSAIFTSILAGISPISSPPAKLKDSGIPVVKNSSGIMVTPNSNNGPTFIPCIPRGFTQ